MLKFSYKIYHYVQVFFLRLISWISANKIDTFDLDKILIISPHPDDEVFGCGGLIHSLTQNGKQIDIIILSEGEAVHRHCCPGDEEHIVSNRKRLTEEANKVLGLETLHIHRMKFPDGNFFSAKNNKQLIQLLENKIQELNPSTVFIPHPFENSPDHIAATEIIANILNKLNIPPYYYCVWTWYHMPIYKIFQLSYKKCILLKVNNQMAKNKAIDIYTKNNAKCGTSFSGDLPTPFIFAFRWKYELFFKS